MKSPDTIHCVSCLLYISRKLYKQKSIQNAFENIVEKDLDLDKNRNVLYWIREYN